MTISIAYLTAQLRCLTLQCSSADFAGAISSGLTRRVACLLGRAEPATLELQGGGSEGGHAPLRGNPEATNA